MKSSNEAIRCAVVASFMGPYYSNFVASLLALEKHLAATGCYTVYVFPQDIEHCEWVERFREINSHLYFLPYSATSLNNILALRRIFKQEKINVVYTRMGGWDFAARFAVPFTPLIWHIDMAVNVSVRSKYWKNWLKYRVLALWHTYFIGVSNSVAEAINSLKPRHECLGLPNALDMSRLRPRTGVRTGSEAVKRLLIFAYNPHNKGLDITLDALEKLNADGVRFELLVSAQEKTYAYMKERYETAPSWVTMLPPTDDAASLYEQSDVVMVPSLNEGFSYCLAEGIYSGLSAVYSDVPGMAWAGEFRNTCCCRKGDATDLARAIEESTAAPMTAEAQEYNRNLMNEKYSLAAWTEAVADYIRAAVCP